MLLYRAKGAAEMTEDRSLEASRVGIGGALGGHLVQPSHLTDENPETQRSRVTGPGYM